MNIKRTKRIAISWALAIWMLIPIQISAQIAVDTSQVARPISYGACVLADGNVKGLRIDTPFAMHSVMKFPQAIYVADYLRKNGLGLTDSIPVCKDSLDATTWSPMLATFTGTQYFTYAELLKWSLAHSDNNSCDILFATCGSPRVVQEYLHSLGFTNLHIRWTENEMKQHPSRAIDNSSTPREMARLLEWFYLHKDADIFLSFVFDTMAECQTGTERIAAVMPKDGTLVHKTGSGFTSPNGRQDRNDVGIIIFPDGKHISLAIFVPNSQEENSVATVAKSLLMPDNK